jgi:hypothetical protein
VLGKLEGVSGVKKLQGTTERGKDLRFDGAILELLKDDGTVEHKFVSQVICCQTDWSNFRTSNLV